MSEIKPFIKWVGGKTQIMNILKNNFPKKINNYHEIFLGGGSVLLSILSLRKNKKLEIKNKIYAYDINQTLINLYINIQNNYQKLHEYLENYFNTYDKLDGKIINRNPENLEEAKTSKESYYYYCRSKFNNFENKSNIECSALFIFLNKTCFRGLYREGPKGYNVPYGHYKKTPACISLKELSNISDLIKDVEFKCLDYSKSLIDINENDFIYLDPPYAPENNTSFVGYVKDGFNIDDHNCLFKLLNKINEENKANILLSNAKVDLVVNSFNKSKFNIENIICKRTIHSKKPDSKTTEVLIRNYNI